MGIGLINAKAIAIISQRYQGKERVQMLGIRGSMELIGGASCSLFSWTITENSLDLCLSYLWFWFCDFDYVSPFLPTMEQVEKEADYKKKTSSEQKRPGYDSWHGSFSRFVICINSSISLRVPLFQVAGKTIESGQSALVLSLEQGMEL